MTGRLLGVSSDAKTIKGEAKGYLTGILYLAPHTSGGTGNLCADASPGCIAACLNTAGRGAFHNVQASRLRKTVELKKDRPAFLASLSQDIARLERSALRRDMIPAVRLNGTADIPWENLPMPDCPNIMSEFPTTHFYDYTKSVRRMLAYLAGKNWPENYSLTFSRSECNEAQCDTVLAAGGNVAVVFATKRGEALPATWHGRPVVDGDVSDLRFLDGHIGGGQVIGVRAKGAARRDPSGFVVPVGAK